jgi:hypothetical protein
MYNDLSMTSTTFPHHHLSDHLYHLHHHLNG